ncbi:hybrid sensor histidine kinase/response regulator [Roseinatronobacter monicus]|uniref:histidine kinase n=1 Tax=Roseinatronobacter monicus TaxID=393481 RepID=A0A543K9S6_9RHOB|nr:PAS-domain containing protein [Roseinatronobacter monicus]TQM91816.1 signal transduction histidine kinase [Roseinatronobacter monicus]
MLETLLTDGLSLEEENARLRAIVVALMDRSERAQSPSRPMGQLSHVVALEQQIRTRTRDLAETLDRLRIANARLSQAERDAVNARNNLADALEAMGEGFAMFDASDTLTMWNSRFCADLPDVRRRIGPGLSFRDYVRIVSDSPALNLPDPQARHKWVTQRMDSHRRRDVNFMVPLIDDQWLQVSEQRMASGGTAVTQTDVTGMVRNEREERVKLLDEQAQMVRATLDHIDQGVMIFDAKARLAGWNRRLRELFSPPVDLLGTGTPFTALLNNLMRRKQLGRGNIRAALTDWANGPPYRPALTLEIVQDEGSVLELSAQAMPDRGFVVSFTDLTKERRAIAEMHRLNETLEARVRARTVELESARDEAERANTSKSRFVASASHDLLQPLNAAKLFLASLSAMDQPREQARLTERITSAFGSVEQILGALLDISKFDIGAARAKTETFALAPLLERLREEFMPVAHARGLKLQVLPSRAHVTSDPIYLKRILQNLLSNAIRYTDQGRVVLGVRHKGGTLRLEVWDTGPGIPEDKQTDIFQEFTRLAPAGSDGGMGLGLAIVEQACALLHHPLMLRSVVGRGTVFSVTVPKTAAPPSDTAAQSVPEPRGALDDLLVLVVENDADVRHAMMGVLEDWGASPIEATKLTEADALVAELGVPPDVILADYQLDNNESGLDLIEALRARHGPVPAVLITANHSPELITQAEECGILLMTKPLGLRRLRRLLQQVPLYLRDGNASDGQAAEKGDHSYWLRQAAHED